MNNNQFLPETGARREYRFRPLRTALVCVLIAALLVSMSVGFSYAKYVTSTKLAASVSSAGLYFDHANYEVKARVPGEDTVFELFGGKVKVTIPKTATGENLTNADYLAIKFNSPSYTAQSYTADYSLPEGQYKYDLHYYLYGYTYDKDQTRGFTAGHVVDDNKSIKVALKVGTGYVEYNSAATLPAASTGVSHAYSDGYVVFDGIKTMRGGNTDSNTTMDFVLQYDKTPWGSEINNADDVSLSYSGSTISISSADELAQVAWLVNNGVTDFAGKTVVLSNNISLYTGEDCMDSTAHTATGKEKRPWVPIGTASNPFRGSFDGNGYAISGLNLRNFDGIVDGSDVNTAGLFGAVENAGSISNFSMNDLNISARLDNTGASGLIGCSVGAVVGFDYGSDFDHNMSISNIDVSDMIVTSSSKYLGGIMGYGIHGSIDNCSVSGLTMTPYAASQVGGIIALQNNRMNDSYEYVREINISNCSVSGASFAADSDRVNGGIIAQATNGASGVENCSFSGSGVDGTILAMLSNTEYYEGGKLAYTIKNCSASDPVFGGLYEDGVPPTTDYSVFPVIE